MFPLDVAPLRLDYMSCGKPGVIYKSRHGEYWTVTNYHIIRGHLLALKMTKVNLERFTLSNRETYWVAPEGLPPMEPNFEYQYVNGGISSIYNEKTIERQKMRELFRIMGRENSAMFQRMVYNPYTGMEEPAPSWSTPDWDE